ncbi:hypothetical protein PG999_003067 [Apiospora kogelbergensis]|uniref:Uncharacterized protein n=1 Tax=Apiospora kogelbergensis TaxID=1337665 RepID=A0AAW0R9W7_9PEZI
MKPKWLEKDLRQKCQSASSSSPPPYENPRKKTTKPKRAPPANPGATYNASKASEKIIFTIFSEPQRPRAEQSWWGYLRVKTANVPRLMQEGLSFGPENMLSEEGYMCLTPKAFPAPDGSTAQDVTAKWPHVRHFYLRDTRWSPRWLAHLECAGTDNAALAGIRPCELTHHHVVQCVAWASKNSQIYNFVRQRPQDFVNCVYDDMPLEGLWPHPKPLGNCEAGAKQEDPDLYTSPPNK